jgi:hypothetical protein
MDILVINNHTSKKRVSSDLTNVNKRAKIPDMEDPSELIISENPDMDPREYLPVEIWAQILHFCDAESLLRLVLTHSLFRQLIMSTSMGYITMIEMFYHTKTREELQEVFEELSALFDVKSGPGPYPDLCCCGFIYRYNYYISFDDYVNENNRGKLYYRLIQTNPHWSIKVLGPTIVDLKRFRYDIDEKFFSVKYYLSEVDFKLGNKVKTYLQKRRSSQNNDEYLLIVKILDLLNMTVFTLSDKFFFRHTPKVSSNQLYENDILTLRLSSVYHLNFTNQIGMMSQVADRVVIAQNIIRDFMTS